MMTLIKSVHEYEVRPRNDHRGVDLISDVLPFGRLWYDTPDHAIGYAMHRSRSHDAVIRVYVRSTKRVHRPGDRGRPRQIFNHKAPCAVKRAGGFEQWCSGHI